ncbi:hypothetical protein AB0K16_46000 [Nonomuraea jabiensis]|uniref:hypothetical protein n=1 Tax=Nonomuraea jabiensis TaxID=882448 RepID=UPI003448A197
MLAAPTSAAALLVVVVPSVVAEVLLTNAVLVAAAGLVVVEGASAVLEAAAARGAVFALVLARGVVPGEVKGCGGVGDKASAVVRSAVIGAFTFTSQGANG